MHKDNMNMCVYANVEAIVLKERLYFYGIYDLLDGNSQSMQYESAT